MAVTGDFLIFRLCESQRGVQCLLGVHEPLSNLFHKYILHSISYGNTEDRNTIFNVKLFVFHKFTTNWTSQNQRYKYKYKYNLFTVRYTRSGRSVSRARGS